MGILKFKANEVKRLIDHTRAAPDHSKFYGEKIGAALMLVGDRGVYLMSNGIPHLQAEGKPENHSVVAYAEGCNPETDEFDVWYDNKRDLFGGDDGADPLAGEWLDKMAQMIERGQSEIQIKITRTSLELMEG